MSMQKLILGCQGRPSKGLTKCQDESKQKKSCFIIIIIIIIIFDLKPFTRNQCLILSIQGFVFGI